MNTVNTCCNSAMVDIATIATIATMAGRTRRRRDASVKPLRDLRFTPASPWDARRGLLGWVAFTVGDGWRVDGVAIRRTRQGRLALSFPSRLDAAGREHPFVRPASSRVRRAFERAVLDELGLGGAS